MESNTALRSAKVPPGPRGYPLVGVFPEARRDPLGFFLESRRRYGDVVSMRFGTRRLYLLSHPDDIKHVLQDNPHGYGKSAPAARIRPLFGDGLTTVDGEHWRRQRRLMRSAFQPREVAFLVPVIAEATNEMLDGWQRIAARGEAMDALSEMRGLTRAIIMRGLFGEVAPARARAVSQALDLALEHADQGLWSPLGWLDALTPAHRRFTEAIRVVDGFVGDMVDQAGRGRAPSETLLSALVGARDPETARPMSDRELRDELKALLVAGHTTTTSTLGWIWYVLFEHPDARQRLQRELRTALGGRSPGADDLQALVYTRMLIEEVLRLYPPTWLTARTPLREDQIRGYRIPLESIIVLSPFVTHRHPGFWEEPDRFDPERFTPERSEGRRRFAYFPFGGGPRSCIGAWLASVMVHFVVGIVAQRYQLALVSGSRVDMKPGLTLRPDPGIPMRPTPILLSATTPSMPSG